MHAGATTEHLTVINVQVYWLLRSNIFELRLRSLCPSVRIDFWSLALIEGLDTTLEVAQYLRTEPTR